MYNGTTEHAGLTHNFTGKQRDYESGIDYFGERYNASSIGRFMTPDPLGQDAAEPGDPQTWNAFAYVRNNPTTNIDPDGLDCVSTSNQTSTSVTVSVTAGSNCSAGQTYVPGTVDMSSLTYSGTTVGYGYTPYDTNQTYTIGAGINIGPTISDSAVAVLGSVYRQSNGPVNFFAGATFLPLSIYGPETLLDSLSLPMSLGLSEGSTATGASAVKFGNNANQSYHTFRHVEEAGIDKQAAESAIRNDLAGKGASLPQGLTKGQVSVQGKVLQYNAYKLPDGIINVGRITVH
jgi:RHS repeat-associated protein